MSALKLGVVMDDVSAIHYEKDSTLAMLLEAQTRGYELYYFEQKDLLLKDGLPYGNAKRLKVYADSDAWYTFGESLQMPLETLSILLMRKDPPFNQAYIYTTYLLEHAESRGVLVVNKPQSLRDANEKLFTTYFPSCTPPTVVTQSTDALKSFWQAHQDIVCKPLDAMGGASIFRLRPQDVNANVVFELLTQQETLPIVAQAYIPEIVHGDKRILMIDGKPLTHALARVPSQQDWRGNLAVGATGIVQPLSPRDHEICEIVGPVLKEKGLYFVGLDVIGDYLTEINVTSPTGIRELDKGMKANIAGQLFDTLEKNYLAI